MPQIERENNVHSSRRIIIDCGLYAAKYNESPADNGVCTTSYVRIKNAVRFRVFMLSLSHSHSPRA